MDIFDQLQMASQDQTNWESHFADGQETFRELRERQEVDRQMQEYWMMAEERNLLVHNPGSVPDLNDWCTDWNSEEWSRQDVQEKAWCESQKFEWEDEEEDGELEIIDIGPSRRSP